MEFEKFTNLNRINSLARFNLEIIGKNPKDINIKNIFKKIIETKS